jgi:hypothetical protein
MAGHAASGGVVISDQEILDNIIAAWVAGFDQGYAEGRNDRSDDDRLAAVHDLACRMIGIRPQDDHEEPPLWVVAS